MTNHLRNISLGTTTCKGTYVVIRGGRIAAKTANAVSLRGDYMIGASSTRSVRGLEGTLVLRVSVRSPEEVVWEGEQCIIGREACPLSRYTKALSLSPGEYVLDVDLADTPPNLEAEICIGPVPVEGSLLISGAIPSGCARMRTAQGSTRSWSLMVGEPVRVRDVCVQRFWLWFFEPLAPQSRLLIVRLGIGEGLVDSIRTELLRVGVYSEVVVDVLTLHGSGKVVFLDPANLTRPLFTMHTEGCGGVS